jgi:hypothetical protein
LEVDGLGPSAGESWKFIKALVDTVDLPSLAKRALASNYTPVALTAGYVGRPGNDIARAERISSEVCSHPIAEFPDPPDSFMPKHDWKRDWQVAMVEMNVRSANAG